MQPRDVIKMCYQAAFGAEHLLCDLQKAREMFFAEFERTAPREMPIFEQISDDFCRVNIPAWKESGMCGEWLFNMFALTAAEKRGNDDAFLQYLDEAKEYIGDYLCEYLADGIRAVHHSDGYRAAECPAYRVVSMRLARLIPILQRISGETRVIAFDGRAASGKSTAAKALCAILDASSVHMDDFFLPLELRTKERLEEVGGNVHYERFVSEVLPHLRGENRFSYNVFDCSKMQLCGVREVAAAKIKVVEGAYALHPSFGDYADIKVFTDVSSDEQMRRILTRNGEQMAAMFKEKWIPMEEAYYEKFKIKEKADIVI